MQSAQPQSTSPLFSKTECPHALFATMVFGQPSDLWRCVCMWALSCLAYLSVRGCKRSIQKQKLLCWEPEGYLLEAWSRSELSFGLLHPLSNFSFCLSNFCLPSSFNFIFFQSLFKRLRWSVSGTGDQSFILTLLALKKSTLWHVDLFVLLNLICNFENVFDHEHGSFDWKIAKFLPGGWYNWRDGLWVKN